MQNWPTVMVVGPGPALRWTMEQLQRYYGYRLHFAANPYEAAQRLENTSVDAVVCEAAPVYTAECRLVQQICERSAHLPIILYVEPDSEEYLLDQLGRWTFHVVRPGTRLEEFHRILLEAISHRPRVQAA